MLTPADKQKLLENHHKDNPRHGKDCPVCFPKKKGGDS